jgi:hypothetical protein
MGESEMLKRFGAVVVLGSVCALTGCGGAEDVSSQPGEEQVAGEQLANTEQAVTNGAVNGVCAESLTLRSSAGGSTIGTMYTNPNRGVSQFYVQSTSGSWSYGYSYSLGLWGYAMSYYLTTNYWQSGTPGVAPFNYSCTRSDGSGMGGGIN